MSLLPGSKPGLRACDYEVREASLQNARFLVENFHYARGASNTAVYIHGLYERKSGNLMGVAWWLPPTRIACESVNRLEWQKVLGLSRLVMLPDAPRNAASFLLSRSVKAIRRDRRFLSLVTYADESQGHTGQIYRASNWSYAGKTGPYPRWLDETGRQVSQKATVSRTRSQMEALGHVMQGRFYKHKFILHLDT